MTSEYDLSYPEMETLPESNESEAQHDVNGSPDHNKNKLSPRPPSRSSGANTMTNKESGSDLEGFEPDLVNNLLSDSNQFETQDKVKGVPLSPNRSKRKLRQTRRSGSIGARKRQLVIGPLSASQQPEQEGKKESLEERMEKSVPNAIKILNDRLGRRINNMKDMEFVKLVSSWFGVNFDLIEKLWPVRSDLKNIKIELKDISKKIKEIEGTGLEEMKKRLRDIEEKINKADEQRQEDSRKVNDLQNHFFAEGVSTDTLRQELYAAFPWLPREEIETNGPTPEQLQNESFVKDEVNVSDFPGLQEELDKQRLEGVSMKTQREKLFDAFPWLFRGEIDTNSPTAEQGQGRLPTAREQLLKEIVAESNNKVDATDFPSLKEAIEKTTGGYKVPDYLKPVVIRIEKARGTATDFSLLGIQLLVCAAIQEMEDIPLEGLDWPKLLRWGAVLIKAVQLDFSVKFAENLFRKNVYAFFAFSNIE